MNNNRPLTGNIALSNSEFDINSEMIGLYHRIITKTSNSQGNFFLFVSAKQGEGTTTCAHALASVTANSLGKSVLLLNTKPLSNIDPDIESDQNDLETWLANDETLSKTNCHKTSSGYFKMVVSHRGTTLSEIFSSSNINEFCNQMKTQFDMVILDSPAASMRDNGVDIAYKMDGVILIIEAEKTRVTLVRDVINRIAAVNGVVLGAVLNNRRFYIPEGIYTKL